MPRVERESRDDRRARRAAVDDPAAVLAAGARFLEARPRSADEVRRRLREAGYRPDLVEGTLVRLAELGYLDDAAFARAWVESRDRARPRGARALRDELRRSGWPRPMSKPRSPRARRGQRATTRTIRGSSPAKESGRPPDASDEAAAMRLLVRNRASLLRAPDGRRAPGPGVRPAGPGRVRSGRRRRRGDRRPPGSARIRVPEARTKRAGTSGRRPSRADARGRPDSCLKPARLTLPPAGRRLRPP